MSCDSTPSLLFINNHDGTFREEGVLRGVALSDDGGEQAGMGEHELDPHCQQRAYDDANRHRQADSGVGLIAPDNSM